MANVYNEFFLALDILDCSADLFRNHGQNPLSPVSRTVESNSRYSVSSRTTAESTASTTARPIGSVQPDDAGNDGSPDIDLESDFIDFHYQKAKEDIQQKNFSMAERRLLQLLASQSYEPQRDNDRHVAMLLSLYDCQSGQNKWEDARKTLLNLDNYSIDGRLCFQIIYNLANCYFHLGDSNIASDGDKGFRTTQGTENPLYMPHVNGVISTNI